MWIGISPFFLGVSVEHLQNRRKPSINVKRLLNPSSAWRQDHPGEASQQVFSSAVFKSFSCTEGNSKASHVVCWVLSCLCQQKDVPNVYAKCLSPLAVFHVSRKLGNGIPFIATFPMVVSLLTSPPRLPSCANYSLLRQQSSNISRKPVKSSRKLNMRGIY